MRDRHTSASTNPAGKRFRKRLARQIFCSHEHHRGRREIEEVAALSDILALALLWHESRTLIRKRPSELAGEGRDAKRRSVRIERIAVSNARTFSMSVWRTFLGRIRFLRVCAVRTEMRRADGVTNEPMPRCAARDA